MGYLAALQDVYSTIDRIQLDLRHHKVKQSDKVYKRVLEVMIENRVILRENPYAFVRHNILTGDFEVYIENEGVYNSNSDKSGG